MEAIKKYISTVIIKDELYRGKKKLQKFFVSLFIGIIMFGMSFIILSPLISIFFKSVMDIQDFYNPLIYLIPENFTLSNITTAFEQLQYVNTLGFTFLFCGSMMLIQAFVCSLVGYGFARYKFPGSNILFSLVILTIVVPTQTIMVPLYTQFRYFDFLGLATLFGGNTLNLMNSTLPTTVMTATGLGLRSGLFIYIFRQFYKGLPKEIEEAAYIDGASPLYTYFVIMLPNAKPALLTVMLFSFVWQYNDMFYSALFMNNMSLISIKITSLVPLLSQGLNILDRNLVSLILNAGVLLTILPLIIIYLFLQKFFVQGIERSGIVG